MNNRLDQESQGLRIKALIIKESLQIIRDPSAILISVFLPLLPELFHHGTSSLSVAVLDVGLGS